MKKRIVTLMMLILVFSVISIPVQAQELSSNATKEVVLKEDVNQSPKIIISYSKTVVKYYSSYYSVPQSISYSEYNYGTWFSGTLYLTGVTENGSGWNATFKGTLYGNT